MKSKFIVQAGRFLIPFQVLLSVYFLLRGHNLPGGGFIGGLLLGLSVFFGFLGYGVEKVKSFMRFDPSMLVGIGLLCSVISAFFGDLPLEGVWGPSIFVPGIGDTKLSSVLLFDFGVYLLVAGVVAKATVGLMEERC